MRPRRISQSSTLNGSVEWKSMANDFLLNTVPYLEQFGIGICSDRRMLGQNVAQRRDDRIDSAIETEFVKKKEEWNSPEPLYFTAE